MSEERSPVDPDQRFTASNPCPVCGGHKDIPVGIGQRCWGFMSGNGKGVVCTRIESDRPAGPGGESGWWHADPEHVDSNHNDAPRPGRIVATYDYLDEQGTLLYQVVRFDPKAFKQRRPGGQWGLGDTRRVLYRLPELLDAMKQRATVNIVEGEKDADAVVAAGGIATCNPMGAGKWRDEYSQYLAGAPVRIWADKDDGEGIRHAHKVRRALLGIAASVVIVEAASGKDAYDHLEAGHALDDCVPMRREYGRLKLLTLEDAAIIAQEPVDWIIQDLLAAGEKVVIAGPPKSLKTWLALHIARCIATAEPVLERDAWEVHERQPVLFVQEEGSAQRWAGRLASVFEDALDAPFAYTHRGGFSLLNDDHVGWVVDQALDIGARLITIDPWQRVTPGVRERDESETAPAWDAVHGIASATGASVLLLHHSKKGSDLDLEAIRGSSRMAGEVDLAMVLRKNENSEIEVFLDGREYVRADDEDGNLIVVYDRDHPHVMRTTEWRIATPKTKNQTMEAVVAFLWAQDKPVGTAEIHRAVQEAIGGVRKRETVLTVLRKFKDDGNVREHDEGKGKEKSWLWVGKRA